MIRRRLVASLLSLPGPASASATKRGRHQAPEVLEAMYDCARRALGPRHSPRRTHLRRS
jgi:hypothetical protein